MLRRNTRRWCAGGLLFMFGACGAGNLERTQNDSAAAAALGQCTAQTRLLTERVTTLEDSLPLLACGPEMRSLLNRIRQECSAGSSPQGTTCPTNRLQGALKQAQHELESSSIGLSLLSILRHEIVYLDDHSDRPTSTREARLAAFTRESLAKDTRFLVVTSAERGTTAAEHRANLVIDLLIQHGIPALRIEKTWLYNMRVPAAQLKLVDRSGPTETKDMNRAVFVLRTEC